MRRFALLPVLALLFAVAGCTRYWVPGMTLPPKTSASSKNVMTTVSPQLANLPGVGLVDQVLTLSVSCPYDTLTTHLDQQLLAKGYSDTTSDMPALMAACGSKMRGEDLVKISKIYSNPSSQYVVVVIDRSKLTDPGSFPGLDTASSGTVLTVIKKK
jgi:hypothetical protein